VGVGPEVGRKGLWSRRLEVYRLHNRTDSLFTVEVARTARDEYERSEVRHGNNSERSDGRNNGDDSVGDDAGGGAQTAHH